MLKFGSRTDQARHFAVPELGPNCLQRLSVDGKSYPYTTLVGKELMII